MLSVFDSSVPVQLMGAAIRADELTTKKKSTLSHGHLFTSSYQRFTEVFMSKNRFRLKEKSSSQCNH